MPDAGGNRPFFATGLEGVATFWRIHRRDGVTLGFTSHDRTLRFDGIDHRAAPGMLPSAIRRDAGFGDDSAEMTGVLAHDSIAATDLRIGRFDGARVTVGVVDWETLRRTLLYHGTIGAIRDEGGQFSAALASTKAALDIDPVPRTSPTCRARFCGTGCTLSSARFTHEAVLVSYDPATGRFGFDIANPARFAGGELLWRDGPAAGTRVNIGDADASGFVLVLPLDNLPAPGTRARLREGCDHTLATCAARFGNTVNFQGEPFLPGNDLLTRYPLAQG